MSLRTVGIAFTSAFVGGAVVWIGQSGSLRLTPAEMSYPDLAATLLAAVGVIVAIFGGILAILAIWGFNQMKDDAVRAAALSGAAEVRAQIEKGPILDFIKAEIARLTDDEFKSERMNQRINERVDAVAFGRPEADDLLDDEGGHT